MLSAADQTLWNEQLVLYVTTWRSCDPQARSIARFYVLSQIVWSRSQPMKEDVTYIRGLAHEIGYLQNVRWMMNSNHFTSQLWLQKNTKIIQIHDNINLTIKTCFMTIVYKKKVSCVINICITNECFYNMSVSLSQSVRDNCHDIISTQWQKVFPIMIY